MADEMTQKIELRSTQRGRPLGTFGEAAFRLRSWFWLGEVMRAAGSEEVSAIDKPTHPLSRGLAIGRRFERVQQDGYDPDRITARGSTSLVSHVARKRGWEPTLVSYRHVFWRCLNDRCSPAEDDAELLRALMHKLRLARLCLEDCNNAHALGLIPSEELLSHDQDLQVRTALGRLDQLARYPTLDGLSVLLLLYREAIDLARDDHSPYLRHLLQRAAVGFAELFRPGEQRDTWVYLVETRMLTWNPGFMPLKSDVEQAEHLLYAEWRSRASSASRKVADPREYSRGRAERRWRRASWVRGCCIAIKRDKSAQRLNSRGDLFVSAELGGWLAENRDLISAHVNDAMLRLMAVDELASDLGANTNGLPSIRMPKSMYETRSRPPAGEEEWRHFGRRLPFDIIPVEES